MSEKVKTRITDPTRVITLANVLSVLRAFLTFPILYAISLEKMEVFLTLVLLAIITDYLDGYFARKAHEVTNLGKLLDPLADAIVVMSVILFLVLDSRWDFPMWFFVFYLVRYMSIALSAVYVMNQRHETLSSNRLGKWAINVAALAILLFVFNDFEPYDLYLLWLATLLLSFSGVQYFLYHRRLLLKK
ncbi:MAG: CDP-alcohol phosphatidyltransferase family protein [Fidelibacterota bacterium]